MISSRVRYALRGVIQLALQYQSGPMSLHEIARRENIPAKYLESIFASLRSSGIVRSVKGKNGGYELERRPSEISVFDILSIFEPGIIVESELPMVDRIVWENVEQEVARRLKSIIISDVLDEYRRSSEALNYAI